MKELEEKVEELKKELEKDKRVKKIKELNKKLKKDQELLGLLERYHQGEINLKGEILKNKLFQEYKVEETELNLLILEINQRLKKIQKKKGICHKCEY